MADLDKLLKQQKELAARIQKAKNLQASQERRNDTRRKILVGSFYIDHFKTKQEELKSLMDKYLKKDLDRALFGLEPIKEKKGGTLPPEK